MRGRRVAAGPRVPRVAVAGARQRAQGGLLVCMREVVSQPGPRLVLRAAHCFINVPFITVRSYSSGTLKFDLNQHITYRQ